MELGKSYKSSTGFGCMFISRCSLAKVAPDKTNNQNQTKSFIILVTLNINNRMGVMRQT